MRWFALLLLGRVLGAQSAPLAEVHIFVTLSDSVTRFYPVPAHRMILFRSARDSVVVMTDSSGSATAHVAAGRYRLVSAAPFGWRGFDYSWNVPVIVQENGATVDLRAPDAVNGGATTEGRASLPLMKGAASRDSTPIMARRDGAGELLLWKDPAKARSLSWWWAGMGNIYAGDTGKGYAYATADFAAAVVAIGGMATTATCEVNADCKRDRLFLIGGIVGSLVLSSLSADDAERSARRYNTLYKLGARALPYLTVGVNTIGVSVPIH